MSSYRNDKRFSFADLAAIVLGLLLALSIVLGVGFNLGWFDKSEDIDDTEQTEEETTEDDGTTTEDGAETQSSEDVVYEFVTE